MNPPSKTDIAQNLAMVDKRKARSSRSPRIGDPGISLQLRTNLFLGTTEMGERILAYLSRAGDVFVPEVFDGGSLTGGKKVKFDPKNLTQALKGWVDDRYSLGIIAERHHPINVSLHVSATDFLMFDHLNLSVDSKWFSGEKRLQEFVSVAKDLYGITQANSGYIRNWRDERTVRDILDNEGNLIGSNAPKAQWTLLGLFWANFFGPEYVSLYGRDKLTAGPWHKIENLPDGGLLLFISGSPFDASHPDYEARKQQLYQYLGRDAFTGDLLPKFRTEGRKKRDARPLMQSGGVRDDVFH